MHLKVCEAEAIRYFAQQPGEVVTDTDSDPNGRILLNFRAKIPVPDDISMIIGDALQNLRSSLDYLVWELVLSANKQPGHGHMFPICDTPDAFEQAIKRGRLDNVPDEAIAEIKGLQPYHHPADKRAGTPIRVIDDFTNINKHRRLLITVPAAYASKAKFKSSVVGETVQTTLGPRYDGAELGVSPKPSSPDETMEVEGHAIFFITFNEGAAKGIEISSCMNQLWHFVDKFVIPKFERFFV